MLRTSDVTTLTEFQDGIENFWKFRPDVFLNTYNAVSNEIFLYVGMDRYKSPRTPLDSLAHEYTHFFQFLKKNKDLELIAEDSDNDESGAIRIQEKFRESNFCK